MPFYNLASMECGIVALNQWNDIDLSTGSGLSIHKYTASAGLERSLLEENFHKLVIGLLT